MIGPLTPIPLKAELTGGGPALVTVQRDGDFADLLDLDDASAPAVPAPAGFEQPQLLGVTSSSPLGAIGAEQGGGDAWLPQMPEPGLNARSSVAEASPTGDLFRAAAEVSGPGQPARPSTAEQFNESGWFVPSGQPASAELVPTANFKLARPAYRVADSEATFVPTTASVRRGVGLASLPPASTVASVARPASVVPGPSPAHAPDGVAGVAWSSIERAEDAEIARPLKPLGPRSQPRPASAAPLAVDVHELSTGIAIAAHVGELTEIERGRLRVAIAGLLARHGLVATSVTVFAPPLRGVA